MLWSPLCKLANLSNLKCMSVAVGCGGWGLFCFLHQEMLDL